jgi:outer membrane protein assembly factor BamB
MAKGDHMTNKVCAMTLLGVLLCPAGMAWTQDAVLPAAVVGVFSLKGQDVYILRDDNYQPIRIGRSILVLQGKDVLRVDLGEDSPDRAVKWRAAIETTSEEVLRTTITPGEHITVGRSRSGKVVAIATPGGVTALDLATGRRLWSLPMGNLGIDGFHNASHGEGVFLLSDQRGKLVAVDMDSGKTLWASAEDMGGIRGSPWIADGLIAMRLGESQVCCLDLKTGKVLKSFNGTKQAEPLLRNGILVVTVDDVLTAYDPHELDQPLWQRKCAHPDPQLIALSDNWVVISPATDCFLRNTLEVVSLSDGRPLRTIRLRSSADGAPVQACGGIVVDGCLYVLCSYREPGHWPYRHWGLAGMIVEKVDLNTGKVVWAAMDVDGDQGNDQHHTMVPVLGAGQVWVFSRLYPPGRAPARLHVIDASSGHVTKVIDCLDDAPETNTLEIQNTRARSIGAPALVGRRAAFETLGGVSIMEVIDDPRQADLRRIGAGKTGDFILLADDEQLEGQITKARLTLKTDLGEFSPADSLILGGCAEPPDRHRLVFRDGQVLLGAVLQGELTIRLAGGESRTVPLSQVKRWSFRLGDGLPAASGLSALWASLRSGDRLLLPPQTLAARHVGSGKAFKWPSDGIAGLTVQEAGILAEAPPAQDRLFRLALMDGSILRVALERAELRTAFKDLTVPSTELLSLSRGEPAAPSLMASELELKSGELLAGTAEPDELEIRLQVGLTRVPIANVKLLEHLGDSQVKAQLWDGKQVQGSLVTRLTMDLGQGLRIAVEPLDLVRITRRTSFLSKEQLEAMVSLLGSDSYEVREKTQAQLTQMGPAILPLLRQRQQSAQQLDAEISARIGRIIEQLTGPQPPERPGTPGF